MGIFGRRRRPQQPEAHQEPETQQQSGPRSQQQPPQQPEPPQDAWPPATLPDGLQDLPLPSAGDNGDRWIYEIDGEYASETWAPPESIRRWWLVDRDGNVVGESVDNPLFGPPKDDLARATDPDGPLNWLADPEATVRGWLAAALGRIAQGIEVHWLKVKETPVVLAGHGPADYAAPDLTGPPPPRIGVAVPVGLGVQLAGHSPTVLWGLLLWVMVTDDPASGARTNVWFRPDIEADGADEQLRIVLQDPGVRF